MSVFRTSAKRHALATILLAEFFFALSTSTGTSENSGELSATLKVTVTGFRNTKGRALIALFDKQDGFPGERDKSYRKTKGYIDAENTVFIFEKVPYGSYAVSVYHDENDNGKLDTRWRIIPREGIGTSNNVRKMRKAPSFDDARFSVADSTVTLEITIVYIFDD